MTPASATYLLLPGKDREEKIPLTQGHAWKIGRNEDNDVVILEEQVSRYHAVVQCTDAGEYYLIDMGSRNGSFVNGVRVSFPVYLKDGDEISLGEYQITFHWPGEAAQAVVPKAPARGSSTVGVFAMRKTTVLVADVRDFTKLTQQIDQSVLSNLIGTWFREGGQLMQGQGSWSQKYIGDALMSVWVHGKRDREAREILGILRACVALVNATATLQSRFNLPLPIRIGMGINTGDAILGNAGSKRIQDYTALGDMVNATFRFESATKDIGMDVIIGGDTFQCLSQCSDPQQYFVERTVSLKGYAHPSVVWATTFAHLNAFVETTGAAPLS
jgi:adenylate cyclase